MLSNRMLMSAGLKLITATASNSGTSFTMESLFTADQWTSTTTKKVIVPAGVQLGSSNSNAALTIGATAWGGDLTLEVSGTISGSGGSAGIAGSGGVGGNAFDANRLGNASQKITVNILLGGTIRGGGGGGGRGGNGGDGSYAVNEGPVFSLQGTFYYVFGPTTAGKHEYMWESVAVYYGTSVPSVTVGAFTYTRGAAGSQADYYYISRSGTIATVGGAGGNGGRGQGYDGANASGSAGAAGGTNAGAGGTGGTGAAYGSTGTTGSTGASGNVGAGVAGSAGGLAGYYIANRTANATVNNSGTVQGR